MPIEKLKFNADIMNYSGRDLKRWELTNVDIVVMDKINELIDFINTRDQDRSEQMARMIDRVTNIESNHEGFKESTIHQVNCLLKNIKELENATKPKEQEPQRSTLGQFFHDMKQEEESLLNCPFCNHESKVRNLDWAWEVLCENENCPVSPQLNDYYKTKQEAVSAWNKRI